MNTTLPKRKIVTESSSQALVLRTPEDGRPAGAEGATRIVLLVGGSVALLLAVIGTMLPIMPTTPFLLLTAYCYARSSKRCHTWLTSNRLFGRYAARMVDGRRLPAKTKAVLVACSGATALFSAVVLAPNVWISALTLSIAAAMIIYILLQGRGIRLIPVRQEGQARRPR